jgi:hypothetical protein
MSVVWSRSNTHEVGVPRPGLAKLFLLAAAAVGLGVAVPARRPAIAIAIVMAALGVAAAAATAKLAKRLTSRRPTRLVPVDPSQSFAVCLWRDDLIIGRSACCDIVLTSPAVSAHHCRLYAAGRQWYVEDLNSRNGTRVNNKLVVKRRIKTGDKLSIADREYVVN